MALVIIQLRNISVRTLFSKSENRSSMVPFSEKHDALIQKHVTVFPVAIKVILIQKFHPYSESHAFLCIIECLNLESLPQGTFCAARFVWFSLSGLYSFYL